MEVTTGGFQCAQCKPTSNETHHMQGVIVFVIFFNCEHQKHKQRIIYLQVVILKAHLFPTCELKLGQGGHVPTDVVDAVCFVVVSCHDDTAHKLTQYLISEPCVSFLGINVTSAK